MRGMGRVYSPFLLLLSLSAPSSSLSTLAPFITLYTGSDTFVVLVPDAGISLKLTHLFPTHEHLVCCGSCTLSFIGVWLYAIWLNYRLLPVNNLLIYITICFAWILKLFKYNFSDWEWRINYFYLLLHSVSTVFHLLFQSKILKDSNELAVANTYRSGHWHQGLLACYIAYVQMST